MPESPSGKSGHRLWRMVLAQALHDMAFGRPKAKREAIAWLGHDDCIRCCAAAEIDYTKFMKLVQEFWHLKPDEQREWLRQLKDHLSSR